MECQSNPKRKQSKELNFKSECATLTNFDQDLSGIQMQKFSSDTQALKVGKILTSGTFGLRDFA